MRTMAEDAADDELKSDIDFLNKIWHSISDAARTKPGPCLLYQDLSLTQRVLRDFVHDGTSSIQVDSYDEYLKLREFASVYTPGVLNRLFHYSGDRPLYDLYGVEEEIERALVQ